MILIEKITDFSEISKKALVVEFTYISFTVGAILTAAAVNTEIVIITFSEGLLINK